EAEAARAGLVIGAGEEAMADAGGHVVVTEGNPYLLAGDEPVAVMQCGPGADAADIGAGFGLGYADGGGPFARSQFRPPFGSGGSVGGGGEKVDGASGGAGSHHQGHAAAIEERAAGSLQGQGNVLPTIFGRRIDAEPAGLGILAEAL